MTHWARDFITDYRDNMDIGRAVAPVAVFAMIAISAYDVTINHAPFKALDLGGGIGAVLTGLAAYLYGDAKQTVTQVTQSVTNATTQTVTK